MLVCETPSLRQASYFSLFFVRTLKPESLQCKSLWTMKRATGVPDLQENAPLWNPAVGLCPES